MISNITGVILAGGENRRFGGIAKHEILIDGVSIISRITGLLERIFEEVEIVTNKPEKFRNYSNFLITSDIFPGKGPIGGIHAAMKASSGVAFFVCAGDMPFLDRDLIIHQAEHYLSGDYTALVPEIDKFQEPLHSIYSRSTLGILENYLTESDNPSVREFCSIIRASPYLPGDSDLARKAFININSPDDLGRLTLFS
jgi:molybdopterin-guanine dinucleotide biosynthesis protein A